jgi:hypothetical protein
MIPSLAMSLDDSLPTDLASAHALIIGSAKHRARNRNGRLLRSNTARY